MARGNSTVATGEFTVATGEVTVATGEIGHGRPRGACRNFCQSHVRQKQRHSNRDRDVRLGFPYLLAGVSQFPPPPRATICNPGRGCYHSGVLSSSFYPWG